MASPDQPSSGEAPRPHAAPAPHAPALRTMLDVARVLADFERIDLAVTSVLTVLAEAIPLRSAVLVLEIEATPRMFTWCAAGVAPATVLDVRERARAAYARGAGAAGARRLEPHEGDVHTLPVGLGVWSAGGAEPPRHFYVASLLTSTERSIGLLQLESPESFDRAREELAGGIAGQLGAALDRFVRWRHEQAQREEAEEAAHRLRSLHVVEDAAMRGTTIDEILPPVVEAVRDVFRVDMVCVSLLDEAERRLVPRSCLGPSAPFDRAVAFGAGPLGRIASSGVSAAVDDLEVHDLRPGGALRSMMGAPLRTHGRVRGVIAVATTALRHFGRDDVRLLESIADRIALLIERSQLYGLERELSHKLEAISHASARIASLVAAPSDDPRTILRAIAEEARVIGGADFAALGCTIGGALPHETWVTAGGVEPWSDPIDAGRWVEALGALPLTDGAVRLAGPVGEAAGGLLEEPAAAATAMAPMAPSLGPLLGVPVRHADQWLGRLYLARRAGREGFSDRDERAIQLLASHAAIAIVNAQLYHAARRAIRAREDVLAIVSHDLRNLLSGMTLNVQAALRAGARAGGPSAPQGPLEAVARGAKRMNRLIHDLLDAATIEAGRFAVARRAQPVDAIAREALEQIAPLAQQASLKLVATIPDDLPDALCDRERVLQVLSNLLGNAVKFTPPGGRIELSASAGEGFVHLDVADTGTGIASEDLAHLFDRYWRARDSDARGAGLGLHIAKSIAEAHGGSLTVRTALGVGTRFSLSLPIARFRAVRLTRAPRRVPGAVALPAQGLRVETALRAL